jgi:galactokinase
LTARANGNDYRFRVYVTASLYISLVNVTVHYTETKSGTSGENTLPQVSGRGVKPVEFSAPARVNLIGEHTDYTGGLVLPMAIPFHSIATLQPSDSGTYEFSSENFSSTRSLRSTQGLAPLHEWSDYPAGVLSELLSLGIEPPPFHLRLCGDVPVGAGLSSSASIEVATALALLAYAGASLSPEAIALLCRRAENQFVGSPCGIMDQFVITAAQAGHALLLHTQDLSYELLPMNRDGLAGTRVVIANSTVKHSIASGDYGLRRSEVETGQSALRMAFPGLRDLGEATLEQLAMCQSKIPSESFRRCRHIISENDRVRGAREAMLAGDPVELGRLMTESHASQRDDFECSVEEIDFLVEQALTLLGCFGARLTGGGFGGCTVNLVAAEQAEHFASALKDAYRKRFQLEAPIYICEAIDGAIRQNAGTRRDKG